MCRYAHKCKHRYLGNAKSLFFPLFREESKLKITLDKPVVHKLMNELKIVEDEILTK
jgi:hypothetical protein